MKPSKVTLPLHLLGGGFGAHHCACSKRQLGISPKLSKKRSGRCGRNTASLLYRYANFASCKQWKSHQGPQPRSDDSLSLEHSSSCDSCPHPYLNGINWFRKHTSCTRPQSILVIPEHCPSLCKLSWGYIELMYFILHFPPSHTPPIIRDRKKPGRDAIKVGKPLQVHPRVRHPIIWVVLSCTGTGRHSYLFARLLTMTPSGAWGLAPTSLIQS